MFSSSDAPAGPALEAELARALDLDYAIDVLDTGIDLISRDGKTGIELKTGGAGTRDLRAALLQVALAARAQPQLERVVLLARFARLTAARTQDEFTGFCTLLLPDIARRLALVAQTDDGAIVAPDDELTRGIFEKASPYLARTEGPRTRVTTTAWTNKTFEVWKVLFDAWLSTSGPLTTDRIMRDSEASYPTVVGTLLLLESYGEVTRSSDRKVKFSARPQRSLGEILVVTRTMKRRTAYVDATGRPPDTQRILRKVRASGESGVALGGVAAARYYQPEFDLNGLPRVDVAVCTRPTGYWNSWVRGISPALREIEPEDPAAQLTLHHLPRERLRADLLQDALEDITIPIAEPSEVYLHLSEVGLHTQAEAFLEHHRTLGVTRRALETWGTHPTRARAKQRRKLR